MAVNLSGGVKAKLANAKLAQAGSTATVPVTPVAPATPVAPVSPTPVQSGVNTPKVQPTTPVEQKATVQPSVSLDYQDDSEKRLKEIQMNLDKAAKTNPDIFANREQYNQAFKYNDRSKAQKAIVDSAYNSFQTKKTQEQQKQAQLAQQAQEQTRVNAISNRLNTMSATEMVSKGLNDEEKTLLQQSNPTKYQEYVKAYDDKAKLDAINQEKEDIAKTFQDMAKKFMQGATEVPQLQDIYNERMKELLPQQEELNQKRGELTQIEDEMDAILNDTRNQLEGTGAPDSYIRALASKKMEEIRPLYNTKLREYNTLLEDYKTKSGNIEQELGFMKEQFSLEQSARNQQMQQLGFAMDLMNYESPQAKSEREWNDFVKKQTFMEGDINSSDKTVRDRAITRVAQEFVASYQGLVKSTPTQIEQRIKNDMNSGKSFQDSMNAIMEDLKQNKNYNEYMNNRAGVQSTKKSVLTINGKDYWFDGNNLTNIEIPSDINLNKGVTGTQASGLILSGGITKLADMMDEGVGYNCGDRGQCGEWYNDAVGKANGTAVGNTYESKTQFVDKSITVGEPGMGVVYNYGGKYANEGHIGVLASGLTTKNGVSGYYTISANAKGDEKLSKDFIPEGLIAGSRGGFIPTKTQATEGVKTYTNEQKNIVKGMDIKNLSKLDLNILAKNGLSEVDAYTIKAEQSNSGESPEAIKEITGLRKEFNGLPEVKNFRTAQSQMDIIERSSKDDTGASDLALIFSYMKMLDPNSTVREGEFANAQNAASVPDRIKNIWNKAQKGTRLNQDQRNMFKNSAMGVYKGYANIYNQRLSEYKGYVTSGGNPESIGSEIKVFEW